MIAFPPELGTVGEAEEDTARLADIQGHVHAVLKHRALNPAQQVTLLVVLATTITLQHVPDVKRAMRFLGHLFGHCIARAEFDAERRSNQANALRDAPPAGRA